MNTGEEVIFTCIEETEEYIEVENALAAIPNGQSIGFAPWSTIVKNGETIKVPKSYVVYVAEPQPEVAENYQKLFSKISTPSKKLIL